MIGRRRGAPATALLIVAILIGFGFEVLTGAWVDGDKLAEYGAVIRDRIVYEHEYWRLLTAMFLHGDGTIRGDLLHLGVNVFSLYQLGTIYEWMFGTRRLMAVYFISGLLASVTSAYMNEGASVGASGAIFGIAGAFIFSVLRSPRYRHERQARGIVRQLVFLIIANVVIGSQIPKIDMSAHLGGLLAGMLLGALLPHRAPPPPPPREMLIDV
ncbi:MAG: rhomboid family intramembrane serine protease [Acidobacteriota bacterium]|nr:rhomboid family intramembrane serine protease [Acidobacteriota bacterium]